MKILFVNKFFYQRGGAETVFFQERNFIAKKGYTVIDFSMTDERNHYSHFSEFFVPNISYINERMILKKILNTISFVHSSVAVKNLEKLIIQEKPDIVHLHNIYHQLTPSIIPLLKRHRIRIILTVHDYKLVCPSYLALSAGKICTLCKGKYFWKPLTTNCQHSFKKGFLLSFEAIFHKIKKSYEMVDVFLAPSRFMAHQIEQRIASEKIQILHNGIDTNVYRPINTDHGYGLFLGRLSKEKGIKTLLKAHEKLPVPFPLKIIGAGPMETELQHNYPDVEFLGFKTGLELNRIIANSSFVIVPSEWYENCSMVILESMAFGKPIIGSRIGGIPEQIEDGKSGYLFEMGNVEDLVKKMGKLVDSRKLRQQFGNTARKKLENEYSLSEHCNKLDIVYKNLL